MSIYEFVAVEEFEMFLVIYVYYVRFMYYNRYGIPNQTESQKEAKF